MAITTNNQKIAVMEWCSVWEPAIPMVSTSFPTQAHKQQMLWDNPAPLWETIETVEVTASYLPIMGVG
jgi:hypothetical protein